MKRVKVTSGESGNSSSKFKPSKKTSFINRYIDTGGELNISSKYAVLRERNLHTGYLTGKSYRINLQNVQSKLPSKFKNVQKIEIVCTLSVREKIFTGKSRNVNRFENNNSSYLIRHIHHILDDEELIFSDKIKKSSQEIENTSSEEEKSQSIISHPVFEYIGTKQEAEKKIADEIQDMIGGVREMRTPDGERIDLLVDNLLIEVKASSNWDNAIGQILKYKIHFPKYKPVIFLFDDGWGSQKAKMRIEDIVSRFLSTIIYVAISVDDLKALLD